MKKTALGLVLAIVFLLVFCFEIVERADANFIGHFISLPTITIQSDGSIVPQTEFIQKVGDVYSLTQDMSQKYVVVINCSNIVYDGQGHCINGSMQDKAMIDMGVFGYYSQGLTLEGVTNVTIKDVTILGFTKPESIYIYKCSMISVLRVQTTYVRIQESDYNTISNSVTAVSMEGSGSKHNTIFKNNLTIGVSSSENLMYGK